MSEDVWREEKAYFRFVGVSDKLVRDLQRKCGDGFEINPKWDGNGLVALLRLQEGGNYDALINFVSSGELPRGSYGIYLSLVTDSDIGGVEVPAYVCDLYRRTGGTIDFSFTSV